MVSVYSINYVYIDIIKLNLVEIRQETELLKVYYN